MVSMRSFYFHFDLKQLNTFYSTFYIRFYHFRCSKFFSFGVRKRLMKIMIKTVLILMLGGSKYKIFSLSLVVIRMDLHRNQDYTDQVCRLFLHSIRPPQPCRYTYSTMEISRIARPFAQYFASFKVPQSNAVYSKCKIVYNLEKKYLTR